MAETPMNPDAPFCSSCGYDLTGAVESSKCPECGRPLVEVLTRRHQLWAESGKRYRSKATLFGLPVFDLAIGPKDGELRGKAKGIIAIGDIATGWLAIGGLARGIVAIGGLAVGAFSLGGMSLGFLVALGGGAIGGVAVGGGAIGGIAAGGGATGYIAQGGGAVGYYARGGGTWAVHSVSMGPQPPSPEAVAIFDQWSWFLGAWPPTSVSSLQPIGIVFGFILIVASFIGIIAIVASKQTPADEFSRRES